MNRFQIYISHSNARTSPVNQARPSRVKVYLTGTTFIGLVDLSDRTDSSQSIDLIDSMRAFG
jgi:hypothetical protein